MVGQIAVLVRIILHQNLIHDQLGDADAHQAPASPACATASAATTRSAVSTRCALTAEAVGEQRGQLLRCRPRCARADRPSPPTAHASAPALSRRCRGQARSRYSPNVDGRVSIRSASAVDAQSTTMWSHCPDCAASSPTSCRPSTSWIPGNAESSSGATLPRSDSGNRSPSGRAISRHRVSSSARVSRARASRKPPPASAVVGEHPHRIALAGRRHRDAEHVTERMRLVGGDHQHPQTGPRIAHRGGGCQRRLADPALADEQADPGPASSVSLAGFAQPSTRFFRSFSAVSVNRRSALRLSRPIIGIIRSTDNS